MVRHQGKAVDFNPQRKLPFPQIIQVVAMVIRLDKHRLAVVPSLHNMVLAFLGMAGYPPSKLYQESLDLPASWCQPFTENKSVPIYYILL